jgi:peptidoglycan/LPS O-acetylase OafA/YrhL
MRLGKEADLVKMSPVLSKPNVSSAVHGDSRNLDLLRAVAVLCVFLAHLFLFLIKFDYVPVGQSRELWNIFLNFLGHLGVLFFFVHTALVLMLSLDRTSQDGAIGNFYIRRAMRIYPSAAVCILAILLFEVPQVPDGTYASWSAGEVVANLFLVQNLFSTPDMIMPFWSLPRELQMYLALPFVYLILKRFPSTITALLVWLGFLAAAPHYQLLACFPCFMGGVVAYQLAAEKKTFQAPAWTWCVAIVLLGAVNLVLSLTIMPDFRADFVLCMLLGIAIPNFQDLEWSAVTRVAKVVAKYSYGIYLFHDPVIWISFVKLNGFPLAARWACLVALMAGIPYVLHHWVEAPMMEVGKRLATRWSEAAASRRRAVTAAAGLQEPVHAQPD